MKRILPFALCRLAATLSCLPLTGGEPRPGSLPSAAGTPLGTGDAEALLRMLSAGSEGKTLAVKQSDPDWVRSLDERGVPTHANPYKRSEPDTRAHHQLNQGFAVRVTAGGETVTRTLDRDGFHDVEFRGQYPIGFVKYSDAKLPVQVELEAFSPFVPLDLDMRAEIRQLSLGALESAQEPVV